ncbi:MerR family transcriptional regulator [Faecalicatena contorta]|uniref:MerR family transcriptional regulator n=1 Tax=Faecalicatena contorta TaxID=39482 RepID=UPI001F24F98A|nr:MerR family transcriptional regulator [Faecalicatena contorta]MCF2679671.1 MerR family transcriptional regulator [Faecalicatena contorta]
MEYSITQLSKLAGVSARTLRYYEEIGLLEPLYTSDAGYRYYGKEEVELLQQILFYRERGFELKQIRDIIYRKDFDVLQALQEHLLELGRRKDRMELLIHTVEQTILQMKGECEMADAEKFKGFKEQIVRENEEKYGEEIRERYGDETVDDSNKKMMHMSENEWNEFKTLEEEIKTRLKDGVREGIKPESAEAKEIALLHKKWISMTWKEYNAQAHKGVASMYLCDERFKKYYDDEVEGCAELLVEAINHWM